MTKGTFLNYQMAEAINLLDNPPKDKTIEQALIELKNKWNNKDLIPGYNKQIGYLPGMKDITIEKIYALREAVKQVDTYTTQNTAAMQYCIKFDENGKFISFDFSKLEEIIKVAEKNKKKIIIDSSVVFGDLKNNNLQNLTKQEIQEIIRTYITTLTTKYGQYIERIDVFNAIYQRSVIDAENPSEIFWIETFGPYYPEQIIKLVRESINQQYKNQIKLCWNEFFLTNPAYENRRDAFLEMIKTLNIDIVGVQDRFMVETPIQYTTSSLNKISNTCGECSKSMSITELSCSVNRHSREHITTEEINTKASQVIQTVGNNTESDPTVISVEGPISDEYDYNHHELITTKNYPRDISTTGKKELQITKQQEQSNDLSSMFNEPPQVHETIRQEPPKVKTITKQNNNGFTNYIVLLISSILCILITMIIYLIKN